MKIREDRAMKILRKLTAFALIVTCMLTMMPLVWAANEYSDVSENAWYYECVTYCRENGLMRGVSENEFAPKSVLTRGQAITILWRLAGEPSPCENSSTPSFADVSDDCFYAEALKWAQSSDIVTGVTDANSGVTYFFGGRPITREQLACLIARYAEKYHNGFAEVYDCELWPEDYDSASNYAKNGMMFAIHKSIMVGDNNCNFNPRKSTTRAEAAMAFMRLNKLC